MSDLMYYRDERMTKRTYEWIKALETELAELREKIEWYELSIDLAKRESSWPLVKSILNKALAKYKGDKK